MNSMGHVNAGLELESQTQPVTASAECQRLWQKPPLVDRSWPPSHGSSLPGPVMAAHHGAQLPLQGPKLLGGVRSSP